MCGIVGVIAKNKAALWPGDLTIFEEMLIVDSLRGKDSTGVFAVLGNSQVRITKAATHPLNFVGTKQWEDTRSMAVSTGHIVVGHNRKATQGAITRDNAHPFVEGNIILVHNGTIPNHKNDVGDAEVDSHAVCQSFAKDGYEKTLAELGGAWALVWYDLNDKCLYAVRNDERPLCIIESEKIFVLASEGYMGGWVMARNATKSTNMKLIPPRELYKFQWTKGTLNISTSKLPERVVKRTHWEPDIFEKPFESELKRLEEEVKRDLEVEPKSNIIDLTATRPTNEFQKWYNHYPKGTHVLFHPVKVLQPDEGWTRYKLEGQVYLPGKPIFQRAISICPAEMEWEDVVDLSASGPLVGRVINIARKPSDGIVMHVTELQTDTMVPIWNNADIPMFEWRYICEHEKCTKCGERLNINMSKFTSITPTRVVCDTCVTKNFNKMPKEMQDAFESSGIVTI